LFHGNLWKRGLKFKVSRFRGIGHRSNYVKENNNHKPNGAKKMGTGNLFSASFEGR